MSIIPPLLPQLLVQMTLKQQVTKAFDGSAKRYAQVATVQNEIGQRLLERLDYIKLTPTRILDLGCASGVFSQLLKKRYPKAEIVSLDLSHEMLKVFQHNQRWKLKKAMLCNADMECLPFKPKIFDVVFCNQVLHWSSSMDNVFEQVSRVLTDNGLFLFSTLGPDTFKELAQAWAAVDGYQHINEFIDMHDVGDKLLANGFQDPVVDMEMLTLSYSNLSKLLQSIKQQGVKNVNPGRNLGLTGKNTWQQFESQYQQLSVTGKFHLSYEVVYGLAWKSQVQKQSNQGDVRVPISTLKRS